MRSVVLTQNPDIVTGMRLTGIVGEVVEDRSDCLSKLKKMLADPHVGIIMLTHDTMALAEEEIMELKLKTKDKLIIEIPDFGGIMEDRMSKYIRESIGITID